MRTTLTLDDDVASEIRRLQKRRSEGFKQTVNAVLRAGLSVLTARQTERRVAFRTEPVSLGVPRLKSLDNIAEVLAVAEGEEHR